MSDLRTGSDDMWINSHPITVDFDGAQQTLIRRHFHESFYPLRFRFTPTNK